MAIDISIIIPLFNKEKFVERVLACIEMQTFANWECIIVDDGSTDKSQEIVENFIRNRGSNWVYLRQNNQGQAVARNNGIGLANGKYIAFLDADDLWPINKLSAQFYTMEKYPSASLILSSYAIFNESSKIPRVVVHKSAERMLKGCLSLHGYGTGLESVGMARASLLNETIRFDENLSTSSGLDFAMKLSAVGEIILIKSVGLFYRISDGQWHSDADELSRNLVIIRDRYEGSFGLNLRIEHEEYLYWLKQRQQRPRFFIVSILRSFLRPGSSRFKLFFDLLMRYGVVRIRGFLMFKAIKKQLDSAN